MAATYGRDLLDVNGDGSVTPADALAVVNELNARTTAFGEGEAGPRDDSDLLTLLAFDTVGRNRRRLGT